MTVRELIKELRDYNQDAIVFVGDNLYNTPELCFGGSDGCTKKNCEDVGIHIKERNDCEIKQTNLNRFLLSEEEVAKRKFEEEHRGYAVYMEEAVRRGEYRYPTKKEDTHITDEEKEKN